MLRLQPMTDRAKDAEILALRHQLTVLQRQLHGQQIRSTPADRAFLAARLRVLPGEEGRLHGVAAGGPVRPEFPVLDPVVNEVPGGGDPRDKRSLYYRNVSRLLQKREVIG